MRNKNPKFMATYSTLHMIISIQSQLKIKRSIYQVEQAYGALYTTSQQVIPQYSMNN